MIDKILIQEDIDLLSSEGWLTEQQQKYYNIFVGNLINYSIIENLCPDVTVLNFIFKES